MADKANRLVIVNPRRVVLIGRKPPPVGWIEVNSEHIWFVRGGVIKGSDR